MCATKLNTVHSVDSLRLESKESGTDDALKKLSPYQLETSTKIEALLQILHQTRREALAQRSKPPKTIVFSQWNAMLTLLEKFLSLAGYEFTRLDGKMTPKDRKLSLERFAVDPNCTVFLATMKAGGLGLNLTSASRVVLFDPWWNPAAEDQAIDRVHRIGQVQPVIVTRFIMKV
jgi:DNA repair protein RAD16